MKRTLRRALEYVDKPHALTLALGAGLALRLLTLFLFARTPLISDARAYHLVALQFLHGARFAPIWPPGLPYYLALVYRIGGPSEFAGRASMLLFYVASSLLLYLLVKKYASRRGAVVAVFVFALYPNYIYQSITPYTELPVATGLLCIVLLTILVSKRTTWPRLAALGLVLGAVTLTRPSSILLLAWIPLYLGVRTRRVRNAVIPIVVSLLVIASWLGQAYEMNGQFVPINYANSANFFYGNNPYTPLYKTWWFGSHSTVREGVPRAYIDLTKRIKRYPRDAQDRLYRQLALDDIRSRPDLFLVRTLNRIRSYFAFDTFFGSEVAQGYSISRSLGLALIAVDALFYLSIMVLAIYFLFRVRRSVAATGDTALILGTILVYAIPYWLSFSHPTYHFPGVPLFGVFAARAVEQLPVARGTERMAPPKLAANTRIMVITLALFAYIQAEWVVVMFLRHA